MKTTLSLVLGGLSLVSAAKIDSFNPQAISENTAFIESEFGEELRNNNGTNLESSKFYLRQKNEDPFDGSVKYGLFEGKVTPNAKSLLRFTPPAGTSVDELIKMTCYSEENSDKDFDLEALYTDSKSLYIEYGDVLYCTDANENVISLTKSTNSLIAQTASPAVSTAPVEDKWEDQRQEMASQAADDGYASAGSRFSDTDEYLRYTGWALSAVGAGLLGYAVVEHMTASDIDSKASNWEAVTKDGYMIDGETLDDYYVDEADQIRANAEAYAKDARAKQADHESMRNIMGGAGLVIGGAGLYMSVTF
ncbi:hypothetical protein OAU52_00835 [bacterium]|nr:hypothetical protein [bacterium]